MKIIVYLAIAIFFVFGNIMAKDITIHWDANTEPDLAGYRLYETFAPGQYTFGEGFQVATIQVGVEIVTITVPDEDADFLYWVLTAFNIGMEESGPSNEVQLDTPPVEEDGGGPAASSSGGNGGSGGCFISTITKERKEIKRICQSR